MTEAVARVVLVTGAASGIGAATARRIAGPDTALLLHTRKNRAALEAVAAAAASAGSAVDLAIGDLADPALPAALVGQARGRFGRLDQIVSNAGQAKAARFGQGISEQLDQALASMAGAFCRLAEAALGDLESSRWGRVVAVSSFVAHVFGANDALFPATSAAKGALEALAKALAFQLAGQGTTVNCVSPGFTRKEAAGHSAFTQDAWIRAAALTPNRRLGEPADMASAIAFLLSREAAHITGQVIHVDGGLGLP